LPIIESFNENLNENNFFFSQDYFEIHREKEKKPHKNYLAKTPNQRGERGYSERQNMSKVSNNLSILLQSGKVGSRIDF